MGEATPAQSAAGAFGPMLAVGMGSMAAHGAPSAAARGSAVPQLHSAIVERLRARIELCRRHHSTCEDRYRRGQAESSDREHESTLHLLNVVQQGPGARKGKSCRGAAGQPPQPQPPPDYGARGANGEHRGAELDHKMSTRIALQGSLRRKLEGHAPKQNSLSCTFAGSDFKRVRLEIGSGGAGRGPCDGTLSHAHPSQTPRKNFMIPDVFNATLKEMKKEPTESQSSCGRLHTDAIFDFKDEGGGHIDPELQDLFDELTKSVPPLNDLDFEKMLKQDDSFSLELGRPGSAGLRATERPIKLERSPDYTGVQGGSPQLRPSSAGPSFALTASPAGSPAAGRSLPCWPEISHAEQLKQMAANQHQPTSLLHHNRQLPPAGLSGWGSPAFQDKGARPRLLQQGKGTSSCLFNSNGVHHVEMKPLTTKPGLHFSPKVPPLPTPMMAGNKTDNHRQRLSPQDGQNQNNTQLPTPHFQNRQHVSSSSTLLQGGALPYKMSPHHQGVPCGPRPPGNGNLGQPRLPVSIHQPKAPVKSPVMQRQPNQVHRVGNTSEKDASQDQLSRHLTRPPPDYQRSVFPGANPSQSSMSGSEKDLQSMSCQLSGTSASELTLSNHRFDCGGQLPNSNRMALNPNKPRFLGHNTQGNSFVADQHSSRILMTNMSWPAGLGHQANTLDHQFPQRPVGLPNQVAPDLQMMIREAGSRPTLRQLNRPSPEQRVPAAGNFAEATSGGYHSGRANRVTFDFLPEGDNTVPGINTDSDFIDSLLKSGSGNDDWMKDINLDEILGSHA
ncbi:mastermind-like protein 2 [Corythoichthys intestinalis]|uniref:mastermind-like protein 2 n=1 Tax=Corythoichthys intestinalis TaxID=161448 RepID=UPI0025A4DB4E|nr:mastermind-like protein 2 [Corythoichthys intestinalis]